MSRFGVILVCLAVVAAGIFYLTQQTNRSGVAGSQSSSDQNAEAETFPKWKEFEPKSGLFKVLLPHPPHYAKDLVPIPDSDKKRRYDMYASEKIDGTLFMITVITYPAEVDMTDSHEILQQIVNELKHSKSDNQITNLKDGFFQTHPAVDFTINNKEIQVEGKAFIVGNTVFVLSYVVKEDHFDPVEYQEYIDSFQLTPKNVTSKKNRGTQ